MNNDLAKRAVACKGWRWLPGMLAKHPNFRGFRVSHVGLTGMRGACHYAAWFGDVELDVVALPLPTSSDVLPDLTDPATLGALLALVAQEHGVSLDDVHLVRTTGRVWSVWVFRPDESSYRVSTHEPSRAEALVAALEAAP
jgi:hypothetical protein